MGGYYELTPRGIMEAEVQSLASQDLLRENWRIRNIIMNHFFAVFEEQGPRGRVWGIDWEKRTGIEQPGLWENLQLLVGLRYVETYNGGYRITDDGREAVQKWQADISLAEELKQISDMEPQPRGRALQRFFAKLVERDGWDQEEGVQTDHEEMDVVVSHEREFYLVECKWVIDRIEASVVRELHGKLSNRIDVRGILVSMSGFTEGASTQVKEYI